VAACAAAFSLRPQALFAAPVDQFAQQRHNATQDNRRVVLDECDVSLEKERKNSTRRKL